MNIQPIEKRIKTPIDGLSVVGVFNTIQGEGPYTGRRAIFVRLAGCNLQCPGCDTDYTTGRRQFSNKELFQLIQIKAKPPYLIVITGGEPFRQNITPLTDMLLGYGYKVQVESNGSLPPSEGLSNDVFIVCSPKTGKLNKKMMERINCFKYVLNANSVHADGLPIKALDHSCRSHVARPPGNDSRPIFLQPMDSQDSKENKRNIDATVKSCIENGYLLQLQTHKIVGVE